MTKHNLGRMPAAVVSALTIAFGLCAAGAFARDEPLTINDQQYFAEVDQQVWDFRIGGYPVFSRWLKARRGRQLDEDELAYAGRLVAVLRDTLRLMREIDATIPSWPMR